MICSACGHDSEASAKFCSECGARLALRCPSCAAPVQEGAKFCSECGASLQPSPSPAPAAAGPAGEKKHITVLFADVAGSMDLQERLDAEVWAQIMGRFVAILAEGVRRFGGTVDKFTGDGIMALFGAPVAQEDHARRACHAAWHLTRAIGEYSEELRRTHDVELQVRLGLNSGEVVVGRVGDDVTIDPTALGHTVGLAQRMEAMAEPAAVYLTGATAKLVTGYFELRDLGARDVKGVQERVDVFELVGPGAYRTALEVATARGLTPFVGRDRELAVLEAALADVTGGAGRVVGIVAEPGLGKSRLCHEFAQRCRAQGLDVFAAHALAHTRSVPFVPILEMMRAVFGIDDHDDPPTARAKISADVLGLAPDLVGVLALLYDFLGVADPDTPAPTMDPDARQRKIFAALNRLRRARSARRPFVALIEDLQWLDPGSEAYLENLVNTTSGIRLLVVTTCRPEYRAPWAHRAHYAQLPLGPLVDDASDTVLRDLLGQHPSVDGVAELVRGRTDGNPFFIEEVVHSLVEEGSLAGERGAYQLARTIDEVRIPATVNAVLAARIDRLGDEAKTVLQTAAVVGRQFSAELLGMVTGLASHQLDDALGPLVETELIYETSAYAEQEYAFKHALVEEVAYGSQLAQRRSMMHVAVAEALAALHADKLDERAALIAHHYEVGGSLLAAAHWTARAAAWAGFGHPVQAARHWRGVRTLTDRLDPAPEAAELGIQARLMLLGCIWRVGAASEEGPLRYEEEAAGIFAEGERFAEATGQVAMQVLFLSQYAVLRYLGEDVKDGHQYSLRATHLADKIGDPVLRVNARAPLVYSLFMLGRASEAAAVSEDMMSIIGEDRSMARNVVVGSPYAWCRMTRAIGAAYCDAIDQELVTIQQVIDLMIEEGDRENEAAGRRCWAVIADLAGADPAAAADQARRAVEWAEEAGGPWGRIFMHEGVAISHARQGEWLQAIAVVDEALAIARERRIGQSDMPMLLATRARAQIGLGDIAGARASAHEGVDLAVRCGAGNYEVAARLQLARALLADPTPGHREAAEAELDAALARCKTLGLRAYEPHLYEGRADLALAVGDQAAYDIEIRMAHRLFVDVGATGHARRIGAELSAGSFGGDRPSST